MTDVMIQVAFLVTAILMVQKLFGQKLHVYIRYGLWLILVLRLLIPVNFISSPISVSRAADLLRMRQLSHHMTENIEVMDNMDGANADETTSKNSISEWTGSESEEGYKDIKESRETVGEPVIASVDQGLMRSYDDLEDIAGKALRVIWITGGLIVGGFLGITHIRFRHRLYKARKVLNNNRLDMSRENRIPIYQVRKLESPCLVGFFHPAIYIGEDIRQDLDSFRYVVTHEQVHYLHKDHIWAMTRVILVTVYWFHPFVWIAAVCSARDGELACDYGTVKRLGEEERFSYGEMLLELSGKSEGKRTYSYGTMLRTGRSEIKERIKRLVEPNGNRVWAGVLAVLLMVVVMGCAFTKEAADDLGNTKKIYLTNSASWKKENKEITDVANQSDSDGEGGGESDINIEENQSETARTPEQLKAQPAQITEETPLGADGPILDYAGRLGGEEKTIVIFHDYFGLVIYDLTNQEIMGSLDLEPIGCNMTQGDDACQVAVSATGETVWLHPMSGHDLYRYEVKDNLLYRETMVKNLEIDLEAKELFDRYLVTEEGPEYSGWHSNYLYEEYQDEKGVHNAYIYLGSHGEGELNFGTLQCVWDDMVYSIVCNDAGILREQDIQEGESETDEFPLQYDGAVKDVEVLYEIPCIYSRISDIFGERMHPLTQEVKRHEGVDFAGEEGTLIKAAADGIVYAQGYSKEYGIYVVLLHENGEMSYYCHCESATVEKDEQVKKGDTIAVMGSTGMSTGRHLHFAISRNGEFVDPGLYLSIDWYE